MKQSFFPGLLFYAYIKSSNTKKTQKAPHYNPQTPLTEHPENQIQDPNPKTPNDYKWADVRKKCTKEKPYN